MSFELNPFAHLGKEWDDLRNRVTELENKVAQLSAQPAPEPYAPPPGPYEPYAPPPGPYAPASGPYAPPPGPYAPPPGPYAPPPGATVTAPPVPQAPAPQAPAPQATPGPQSVPTYEQLLERGMQVSEAKGDKTCIDLIAKYGGKDEQGTIKISLVPQDKYAALFADFGAQLGLH